MGLFTTIFAVIIIVSVGSGVYVYNNPEVIKKTFLSMTGQVTQKIDDEAKKFLDKATEEIKDRLPTEALDLIGKEPFVEDEFEQDIVFDPSKTNVAKKENIEVLGRPKKIVEFFCGNDNHCQQYFQLIKAKCQLDSGVCYIEG